MHAETFSSIKRLGNNSTLLTHSMHCNNFSKLSQQHYAFLRITENQKLCSYSLNVFHASLQSYLENYKSFHTIFCQHLFENTSKFFSVLFSVIVFVETSAIYFFDLQAERKTSTSVMTSPILNLSVLKIFETIFL